MSYQSAIDALNALAPELHAQPNKPRRKFSIDEIGVLLAALGNPERRFRSILIAGTNGKGSTASTLASVLQASGLRTGLYTSPHLVRPNERIQIHGAEIADEAFADAFERVDRAARQLVQDGSLAQHPSYFETLTAMGFLAFAEAGLEVAVLEVGMGGRLDATNVVDPLLSIITDISLDHMEWLGSSVGAIAREKAGILRRGGTLITLPQHPEANQAIGEVATELNVRGVSAVPYMPSNATGPGETYRVQALGAEIEIASPLAGSHQQRNIALAIAAAEELADRHAFPITAATLAAGIRATQWPGRLERIQGSHCQWILDVAHNPAGAWALRASLREALEAAGSRALIFSCLRDKPVAEMAQILFPLFDRVIFAPIHGARAMPAEDLQSAAAATGTPAETTGSVAEALERAQQQTVGGVVVISGSAYLVGDARSLLLDPARQPVSAQS